MLTHARNLLILTGLCWAAGLGAQQEPILAARLHAGMSATQPRADGCPLARARAAAAWSASTAAPRPAMGSAAPPEGSFLDAGRSAVFAP